MPRALLQKFALYSILPCLLVCIAILLNNLFQPEFQWKLKLLESEGESYRIDNPGTNTTKLFKEPSLEVYSEDGGMCLTYTDVVYVQNTLMQDKLILEKWINSSNKFTFIVLILTILHAVGNTIYLLIKQKVNLIDVIIILFLVGIIAIGLITVLGPLSTGLFVCWARVKVEAELTKISFDSIMPIILSVIMNIIAIFIMAKHYAQKNHLSQVNEET